MTCIHDPLFYVDGRCTVCTGQRRVARAEALKRREATNELTAAETQDLSDTTRRIWRETEPIEY